MERLKILDWEIEIDREKTIQHYKELPLVSNICCCSNCINYVEACSYLPIEFLNLSENLGIDFKKAAEIFYCTDYDNGTCLYWAGCNIIGRIISGPDIYPKLSDIKYWEDTKAQHKIPNKLIYTNNFHICFYTIPPIIINELQFDAITLDFNGILLRIKH